MSANKNSGHDPTAESNQDKFAYGDVTTVFARKMFVRMKKNALKRRDAWLRVNPLQLQQGLAMALNKAQTTGDVDDWADAANYAMMLGTLCMKDPTKKQLITSGPKVVALSIPSQLAWTYGELTKAQAIEVNVSKLPMPEGDAEVVAQKIDSAKNQIHNLFVQLTTAFKPIADEYQQRLDAAAGGTSQ